MPLSREDRWLTGCLLLSLALTAALMFGVNAAEFRFTWISYFPRMFAPLICLCLQFAYFDRCYLFISPRAGFIVKSCALYLLTGIVLTLFVTGLQLTPFPLDRRRAAALGRPPAFRRRRTAGLDGRASRTPRFPQGLLRVDGRPDRPRSAGRGLRLRPAPHARLALRVRVLDLGRRAVLLLLSELRARRRLPEPFLHRRPKPT